jgi:hypothetical protein
VPGTHEVLANGLDGIAMLNADTGAMRLIRRLVPPFNNRVSGDGHASGRTRGTRIGSLADGVQGPVKTILVMASPAA